MFYSWSDANKITTRELQIQYTSSFKKYYQGLPMYEYHRIATKEYQYVGMTEAAAKACQNAKLQQYTRQFIQWLDEDGGFAKRREFMCVANVTLDSDGDGLWTVNISVNEDQVQVYYSIYQTQIPYELFDLSLDYDETPATDGYLRISSIWRWNARLYLDYEQNVVGFDRASNQFHVENSIDGGQVWNPITPTSSTEGEMYFNYGTWTEGLVRLRWGDLIVSNSASTPTYVMADTITLEVPYWHQINGAYGTWNVDFVQSFPHFNPDSLGVKAKTATSDEWENIQDNCAIVGNTISTPYIEQDTPLYLRCVYGTHQSNTVNNLYTFLVVNPELDVQQEGNQIGVVTLSFVDNLEGFDSSKVTLRYSDQVHGRTYNNNHLTVTEDEDGNCTVSVDVGDQIVIASQRVECTLIYDNNNVAKASKIVYRV